MRFRSRANIGQGGTHVTLEILEETLCLYLDIWRTTYVVSRAPKIFSPSKRIHHIPSRRGVSERVVVKITFDKTVKIWFKSLFPNTCARVHTYTCTCNILHILFYRPEQVLTRSFRYNTLVRRIKTKMTGGKRIRSVR